MTKTVQQSGTSTVRSKKRKDEIDRLGMCLSYETLVKIQIRIQTIRLYFGHLKRIKGFLPENEFDLVYRAYFTAIAVLYRSLFKGLDKGIKIDAHAFGIETSEDLLDNHLSILNIVDKDLAHLDKNSKSHRILDVQSLKDVRHSTMVSSWISEDHLKITMDFLNGALEPAIDQAAFIALKK